MIIVRNIFRARQGKIRQLVDGMKQATHAAPVRPRILTDLSGPINTIVMETCHASLAAYEVWRNQLFQNQTFQDGQITMGDWFETGSTEFYTIEQE